MGDQRSVPEFSRLVLINALGADGPTLFQTANDAECMALAKRLGLQSISDLRVESSFQGISFGRTKLNVNFSANVVQSCIVSLDPVSECVAGQFSVLCEVQCARRSGRKARLDSDGEVLVDPFGEDLIEFIEEGEIDVGELATQYLSLAINPYPRAHGNEGSLDLAYPQGNSSSMDDEKDQENPFSILLVRGDGKESYDCS